MINNEPDLAELSLDVLRRALEPGEADPSRTALVAALYTLDRGGTPLSGGIDVPEGEGEELDQLLSHLGDSDRSPTN